LTSGWHRHALFLLAETGMRIGEAKWLTWADVDLQHNVLRIRAKAEWKPKSGNERAIPISSALRVLLEGLPKTSRWLIAGPRSCKNPAGGGQLPENRLLAYLHRRLKKLGLPGKLHTFRHSFITHALINGMPEAVLRKIVGHVDAAVLQVYTHIGDQATQQAMRNLEARSATNTKSAAPDRDPLRGGQAAK